MVERWITVYIIYGNQKKDFSFNIHFNLRRVLEEALRAFGQQPPFENWQLIYNEQVLPDLNKSLESYGVQDKDTMVLSHVHRVG